MFMVHRGSARASDSRRERLSVDQCRLPMFEKQCEVDSNIAEAAKHGRHAQRLSQAHQRHSRVDRDLRTQQVVLMEPSDSHRKGCANGTTWQVPLGDQLLRTLSNHAALHEITLLHLLQSIRGMPRNGLHGLQRVLICQALIHHMQRQSTNVMVDGQSADVLPFG